jgi:hypothetical protein
MSDGAARVLPHGPLVQLAPRVWQLTGALPNMALPRTMTIWRMDDGGLWIHSAIACDDATVAEIAALGPPRVLVVPSGAHRLDAATYKARWPELRIVAPEGSRAKAAERLPVDGPDTDVPGVVTHVIAGVKDVEHAYELDAGAGSALVFCDALFNVPHQPGLGGLLLRLVGSSGFFGMTRIGRLALLTDARAYAAWLRARADDPSLALICLCHGEPVLADPAVKLREAAARL